MKAGTPAPVAESAVGINAYSAAGLCAVCNSVLPLFLHVGTSEGESALLSVSVLMMTQATALMAWLVWTRGRVAPLLASQPNRLRVLLLPDPSLGRGGRWVPMSMMAVARTEFLVIWAGVALLDASAVAITTGMWPIFLVICLLCLFGGDQRWGTSAYRMGGLLAIAAAGVVFVGISRDTATDALAGAPSGRIASGLALGLAAAALAALSVSGSLSCGRRAAAMIAGDAKAETWCSVHALVFTEFVTAVPIGIAGVALSQSVAWRGIAAAVAVGLILTVAAIAVRFANSQTRGAGINLVLLGDLVLAQIWLRLAGVDFGAVAPFLVGACLIVGAAAKAQTSLAVRV